MDLFEADRAAPPPYEDLASLLSREKHHFTASEKLMDLLAPALFQYSVVFPRRNPHLANVAPKYDENGIAELMRCLTLIDVFSLLPAHYQSEAMIALNPIFDSFSLWLNLESPRSKLAPVSLYLSQVIELSVAPTPGRCDLSASFQFQLFSMPSCSIGTATWGTKTRPATVFGTAS
jgi:hypothetical protein